MAKLPTEISSRELADLLELTPQRISQLVTAGTIPKTRHGFVEFPRSLQAYISARVASVDAERSGETALDYERWRKIKGLNDITEAGTISPDMTAEIFTAIAAAMREHLLPVPDALELPDAIKAKLKAELARMLARLSQRGRIANANLRSGKDMPELTANEEGNDDGDDEHDEND